MGVTSGLISGQNQNKSAYIFQKRWSNVNTSHFKKEKGNKDNYQCHYHKKNGHTKDRC